MAAEEPTIPSDPAAALTLAILYQRVGGWFTIDSSGLRHFGSPEPESEDRGRVIRMLEAPLRQLSKADRNMIFDLYASVAVDDRKLIPSIEEPRRGVQ